MRYNDAKLDNKNQIKVGTYNKCPDFNSMGNRMCCIYVQSIANIGSNTVLAKLGVNDDYTEKNADAILDLINIGNTCYVAGTPD